MSRVHRLLGRASLALVCLAACAACGSPDDGVAPVFRLIDEDPQLLFQRSRQMQELRQADLFERVRVSDYLLDKDRLFARLTLDDEEYELYEQVYARLAIDAPVPDLVVYLQAPVDVLLERISRRGIHYEQVIERRYLERLVESYARFFLEYDAAPVLMVNAAEIDLVASDADYASLLKEVVRSRRGRHYFNPMKSLL